MTSFDLLKTAQLTEGFIKRNQRLAYNITKMEEDERHVLYQASNLFSLLYCQITADIELICQWQYLQQKLFKYDRSKANRYLVYVVPDSLIKQSNLYQVLTRAEQDEMFFRKVFIGLSDGAKKSEIESSLADRIPLWFEERNQVIRQYVPVLTDIVADNNLLEILLMKSPSIVVNEIAEKQQFAYLLDGKSRLPNMARGIEESAQVNTNTQRGPRITELTIQNFRRFEHKAIDLDGDVVIVYGRNGTGKTTLCDALELSIFPELSRLHGDPDLTHNANHTYKPLVRAGSDSESASIFVKGKVDDNFFSLETTVKDNAIVKLLDGQMTTNEGVVRFITRNDNAQKKGFLDILLYTHFLGQHSIRDFIYGNRLDIDKQITATRYNLLMEMFGFGEVEQLKKRLTLVLSQIKRSKVSKAAHQMEAIKTQIRGMQRKYGPKCQQDLEEKGYQIMPEDAIKKYRQVMLHVDNLSELSIIKKIKLPDHMPMEAYQSSCENIHSHLSSEVKQLEAQAADIKSLSRLMTKMGAMFPEITLSNTDSVEKCIEAVRNKMNIAIKIVEQAQNEIQTINVNVEILVKKIDNLQRFSERFEHYLELLGMEQKESETLNSIQKQRNEFLQRHSALILKLEQATTDEQVATNRFAEMQQFVHKCERLLALFMNAKTAEMDLQHNVNRIATIDAAITKAKQKLSQLSNEIISSNSGNQLGSSYLDWESLRANDQYCCPCCGAKYNRQEELAQAIYEQLRSGKYNQELRTFVAELERKNVEATRAYLLETIHSHTNEKTALEQSSRAHAKILTSFKTLANDLGLTEQPPEEIIRDSIRKNQQDMEVIQQALNKHEAKSLREDVAKSKAVLIALKDDVHKKHLEQIRNDILELTRTVTDTISVTDLRELNNIKALLASLSKKLLDLTQRKERLLEKIKDQGVTEQRQREFDEIASEVESLLLRQETLQGGHTLNKGSYLGVVNLEKQRVFYELSKEFGDLSRLFGFLTVQENSDTLKNALIVHEKEKHRWEACYHAIENINSELSKLSYSGLKESLGQYGPLINHIYQKFIRHDIFAALILKPLLSSKARKRDLYLRLRSYSGETEFTPASYLSEAQLNILALSIFLTRVMYQNISALETIFIDDPIQQMDDMNAAAFVDVILGLAHIGKQIIITTCNHEFYRLVAQKMQGVPTISFKAVDLDMPEKAKSQLTES